MALFNRSQDSNAGAYVTRAEAQPVLTEIANLKDRVSALEALARRLQGGGAILTDATGELRVTRNSTPEPVDADTEAYHTYDRSGLNAAARGEDVPNGRVAETPSRSASVSGRVIGVDYGAIAFGLSEIKRKVGQVVTGSEMISEYRGAVQYFADVFAKSDPAFDADEFKRQAGA